MLWIQLIQPLKSLLEFYACPLCYFSQALLSLDFIQQGDNEPKHTSELCKNNLRIEDGEEVLAVIDFPP